MPSGAKKRKAAKKKQSSTTTPQPHQGENDGGELSSPTSQYPSVEVVKKEDNSSKNKSKNNINIEEASKSKSSSSSGSSDDESRVVEKNVVVVESAPNDAVTAVESVPEKISPVVDPVKPVDTLLEEVSQVFDEIQNEKKKDLVVEERPTVVEEQKVVVSETAAKDDCPTSSVAAEPVLKENEVEKLISVDEKTSSVSKDYLPSSTPPENLVSEANDADCENETDTVGHSNRQAPAASPAVAVQRTTTWKSCCGIFDLFSGSER
ncbi:hypothetical protein M8C21_017910 [Ambrosia artemisiifolia]|uniref:Uncharacterized protein n=1 Tax=Ambrosia artemisiifolia TaxID=4212 RepID=A0AAD5C326_AMBAR|nr:hypothetical protein M8C21_017910 [Ambrosia artemisiifolia]